MWLNRISIILGLFLVAFMYAFLCHDAQQHSTPGPQEFVWIFMSMSIGFCVAGIGCTISLIKDYRRYKKDKMAGL